MRTRVSRLILSGWYYFRAYSLYFISSKNAQRAAALIWSCTRSNLYMIRSRMRWLRRAANVSGSSMDSGAASCNASTRVGVSYPPIISAWMTTIESSDLLDATVCYVRNNAIWRNRMIFVPASTWEWGTRRVRLESYRSAVSIVLDCMSRTVLIWYRKYGGKYTSLIWT